MSLGSAHSLPGHIPNITVTEDSVIDQASAPAVCAMKRLQRTSTGVFSYATLEKNIHCLVDWSHSPMATHGLVTALHRSHNQRLRTRRERKRAKRRCHADSRNKGARCAEYSGDARRVLRSRPVGPRTCNTDRKGAGLFVSDVQFCGK